MKIYRLAYFVSHPIQYQIPLLQEIARHPYIDLQVFFVSDFSLNEFYDQEFGRSIKWDVRLLTGYHYQFLSSRGQQNEFSFLTPRTTSISHLLHTQSWDAVWVHGYQHYALLQAMRASQRYKIPLFYRCEATLSSAPQRILKDYFIRRLVKNAAALLWVSRANREYYCHYGAQDDQFFYMPYAVDNAYFRQRCQEAAALGSEIRTQLNIGMDDKVILFASKIYERKNALLLLDAYADLQPHERDKSVLLYIGDGNQRTQLEENIIALGLENCVRSLGFKNQSELPAYYQLADVFVLPSTKEPFGLVINEAMNGGAAIITTEHVGAAHDLVHTGVNGYILPANDREALTNSMRALLSHPDLCHQMGQESLRIIDSHSYKEDVAGLWQALQTKS